MKSLNLENEHFVSFGVEIDLNLELNWIYENFTFFDGFFTMVHLEKKIESDVAM